MAAEEEYLTTAEVAARYRTVASVVRYWRYSDSGPGWVKVGKRVLYPKDQIRAFDRQLREQGRTV
jgi:hypothetical protein